jgi:glycosyltransferase involved in cell wall biosynthesis
MEKIAELYSAADVYVNLSAEETFGLTTAEALACGTPAVVYDATASPELVSPETGIVVRKGDVKGVAGAIGIIRGKGKETYAAACRERALKWFDKNKRVPEYLELYESLTTEKR